MSPQGTLDDDDATPTIPGVGPAIKQEEIPEFLSGPRDGEIVPKDQLHKNQIYVERTPPWMISEYSADTYTYEKIENGDYACLPCRI